MKKQELIIKIFQKLEEEKIAVDIEMLTKIFEATLLSIKESVIMDENIELRGFGVFQQKKRNARIAWNPSTKQKFKVEGKNIPYFKPGTTFKKEVLAGSLQNKNIREK